MRPEEVAYWDKVANVNKCNPWKRRAIAERIFSITWVYERVLEIGIGHADIAAALKVIHGGNMKYIGTDVSNVYCDMARGRFNLRTVQADILTLPRMEGGFTRVIALDSLEHVKPEDREEGYKAIGERLADKAIMVINMPLNESFHNPEFDHAFDFTDITRLCKLAGLRLTKYEEYGVDVPAGRLHYGWVVLERGDR